MPIYKIYFKDETTYEGGPSIHDSRWIEIPDKPIVRLEYFFANNEGIILKGFESYLCFVEAESNFSRKIGNCPACSSKGKLTNKITKYTDTTIKKELIARCTKCEWVGKVTELKYKTNSVGDKYIYVMGLKNGFVTSYRVTLNGKDGEDKYQTGDITKRIIQSGQEYNGQSTNKDFWKQGIK